jgi:glycosyltransferase involved in cell wall biosynthesis
VVRVAFFVDSPSKRAHANAASRLALGLAATGKVEASLVCYSDDPAPPWLPAEVRVDRLKATRASRTLPDLIRYLHAEQPDVLITRQMHANFIGLAAAWIARIPRPARRRWRGKIVVVQDHIVELCHADNPRDNKWLAKIGYRFADGLIAPSPTVRDDTIRWCGLRRSETALVPNPIPASGGIIAPPPHPWLRDGEPPVFISICRLISLKRLDLLIDAFAIVREHHDVRLLILGDGTRRSHAAEQIKRLGLEPYAQLVGWIDDPQQYAAYAWALVHSSDEDGFAQVLTEAMSVGCPAITTDSRGGGPRYVTGDGNYGSLVPRGDKVQLAAAMERMLDPVERERYSMLGQERAEMLSPTASGYALLEFLAKSFRLDI